MDTNNGGARRRIDFMVRVVADVESYTEAGQMMDSISGSLASVLHGRAAFEFVQFQTQPCQAAAMERLSMMSLDPQEAPTGLTNATPW